MTLHAIEPNMLPANVVEGARRIDAYANPDGVLIETREALA